MGIFLLIIGALALILGIILFLPTRKALSNDKEWSDFYQYYLDHANNSAPEEVVYKVITKLYKASIVLLCIALVGLASGIVLQITIK